LFNESYPYIKQDIEDLKKYKSIISKDKKNILDSTSLKKSKINSSKDSLIIKQIKNRISLEDLYKKKAFDIINKRHKS
jgi:hypothetical protein